MRKLEITRLIIRSAGGKQFKITNNDVIVVNNLAADVGDNIKLEKVCSNVFVK